MVRNFFNRRGGALPTVIIVLIILVILGFALIFVSSAEAKQSINHSNKLQAHYIGRSGVHFGKALLSTQLSSNDFENIDQVISHISTYTTALASSNPDFFKIDNAGQFSLVYEKVNEEQLKIKAVGLKAGSPIATDTVALSLKINYPGFSTVNPGNWISGNNIWHQATHTYLGEGVKLFGNPLQSPQNPGAVTTLQASTIYFQKNTDDRSLRQVNNSAKLRFDAEILHFPGKVEISEAYTSNTPSTGDQELYLKLSEVVALKKTQVNPGIFTSSYSTGFENYARYVEFIGQYAPSLTPFTDIEFNDEYSFISGVRYGVAYFGGGVYHSSSLKILNDQRPSGSNSGFYFYPDNTNINRSVNVTTGMGDVIYGYQSLIPINANDPIINAIEGFFRLKTSTDYLLWSNN